MSEKAFDAASARKSRGELIENRVIIRDPEKNLYLEKRFYGSLSELGRELNLIESTHLMLRDLLVVFQVKNGKEQNLTIDGFVKIGEERVDDFLSLLKVYINLREKGFIVMSGLELGGDFKIYERGSSPAKGYPNYTVRVLKEENALKLSDLSSWSRGTSATKTTLLMAIVTRNDLIRYYELNYRRL
ncbi:unnamed protein product [marine sediment metagenome]|uniref:tRNA intron endonuclease catalytic domain-containing protein n=1 Tax=marine sediment metagenome TaxID=412755 RepID=X0RHJ6_9ZZZZ